MKSIPSLFEGPSALATHISWLIQSSASTGMRKQRCLINLNGLFFDTTEPLKREAFQETLRNLASVLHQKNYSFDFMYHVTPNKGADNDRVWENHITSEFPDAQIFCPSNFLEARKILGDYEFSVGSRFHFCLNSLQADTPCIPISYGGKLDSIHQNFQSNNDWGTAISISKWDELIHEYRAIDMKINRDTQEKLLDNFTAIHKCVSNS